MHLHTDFHKAFDAGRTVEHPRGPLTLEVERLGALQITSGRVGICEPYSLPGLAPLTRPVPAGVYPVLGSIAMDDDGTRTLAACRVLLGDEPPVRWELARATDWPPDTPSASRGFDTDCGMLCFADAGVGPVPDFDEVFEVLETDPPPIAAPLRGTREATPWLAVESGRGDGTYAAWWGLDAEGRPTTLELDFQVLWRQRQLRTTVAFDPLSRGPVRSAELATAGTTLHVTPGRWPGFTLAVHVVGRGSDPMLIDGSGHPIDAHRAQPSMGDRKTWIFTTPRLLPSPVHLRLSMGTEREPL